MNRSFFFIVLSIILCCGPAGASTEGGAGIEVDLEPWLSDLGTVVSTFHWEASGEEASISFKAPEGVSAVIEGGDFLEPGDRQVLGAVTAGQLLRVEIFGLVDGQEAFLAVERRVGGESFQLVTVIGFSDGQAVVLDAQPYRIYEKGAEARGEIEETTDRGSLGVAFRPSERTVVIESLLPKVGAILFDEITVDFDIPISAPDHCGPTYLFSTISHMNVSGAPAGSVTTELAVHIEMSHWDASQVTIAFTEDEHYNDPAHPHEGYFLWLNEDPQVDLNKTWTRDKFNQELPGVGRDPNGWFQLWFVDCTGGAVGTVTYWSVEATFDTSTDYDLVADSVAVPAATAAPGEEIEVGWSGHVGGSDSIAGGFSTRIYISEDNNITTADTVLATIHEAAASDPGDDFGDSGPGRMVTLPVGLSDGDKYIGIIVDYNDAVDESNESNNTAWDAIAIDSTSSIDLVADSITPQAGSVVAGSSVNVNWFGHADAGNSGDVSGNFSVGFYLSNDATVTTADTLLDRATVTGPTTPGESFGANGQSLLIPGGTTAGTRYLGMIVDDTGSVAETNETNNMCASTITVGSGGGAGTSDRWLIPAAASAPGYSGSDWRTQVAITNPGSQTREATVYYVSDSASWPGTLLTGPISIGARRSHYIDDVLRNLRPTAGLLYVVLDDPGPVVTSRTYNLAGDGSTFGQGIPGVPLITGDAPDELILPMVHSGGGRYHTNLGLVHASSGSMTVEISIYTAGGSLLANQQRTVTDGWDQINDVFDKMGVGAASIEGGWIRVRLISGSPDAWTCYASVVDKETGDPTYVAGVEAE